MTKQTQSSLLHRHAVRFIVAAIVLVSAVCVFVVIQLSGLNNEPDWWAHETDTLDSAVGFENAVTTQLTAVRTIGQERWSVAISEDEINAWLAHRLRPTIETHKGESIWPKGLESVRVDIEGESLRVGAMVEHSTGRSYAWSSCSLAVDEDELIVLFEKPRIGTTRVPTRVLGRVLQDGTTRKMRAWLDLEDGRIARILAVRVHNGRIELVLETKPG